jgi:hypothetical protein
MAIAEAKKPYHRHRQTSENTYSHTQKHRSKKGSAGGKTAQPASQHTYRKKV